MNEADAIGLTSKANPLTTYALNLKLTNPDDAPAFVYDRATAASAQSTAPMFSNWEGSSRRTRYWSRTGTGCFSRGAAPRAARDRQRGRPRRTPAVGVRTPGRAAEGRRRYAERGRGDFLAENLALALFAAVVGLVAGWLAAPLITNPGAALIGTAGAPPISPSTAVRSSGWRSWSACGDPRPGHPRVAEQHRRGDQRRRSPAKTPRRPHTFLGQAAIPVLFGLRWSHAAPPCAPQCGKHRRHHHRHRDGARVPRLRGQQTVRSRALTAAGYPTR